MQPFGVGLILIYYHIMALYIRIFPQQALFDYETKTSQESLLNSH